MTLLHYFFSSSCVFCRPVWPVWVLVLGGCFSNLECPPSTWGETGLQRTHDDENEEQLLFNHCCLKKRNVVCSEPKVFFTVFVLFYKKSIGLKSLTAHLFLCISHSRVFWVRRNNNAFIFVLAGNGGFGWELLSWQQTHAHHWARPLHALCLGSCDVFLVTG